MAKCKVDDLPQLAVRALMVSVAFSRRQSHEVQSAVLQCALTQAWDGMPSWSWNELIEALCALRVEAERMAFASWPSDADVEQWMAAFLSDAETCVDAPSPSFVAALVRHAKAVWQHLPDGGEAEAHRFDRLCDRLNLLPSCRHDLGASLIQCFPGGAFDIGQAALAITVDVRDAVIH